MIPGIGPQQDTFGRNEVIYEYLCTFGWCWGCWNTGETGNFSQQQLSYTIVSGHSFSGPGSVIIFDISGFVCETWSCCQLNKSIIYVGIISTKWLYFYFQVLNLDGNFIKELPKDSFSSVGLKHLQKISMKNCKIQRIDENAFSELKIMTEINLDFNNISRLGAKMFDGNDRLQKITLSENQINSLAAHQFPPLKNLKTLDLSSNGLKNINMKAFMNLGQSMETIQLHNNQLQNIRGEAFENLHGLKVSKPMRLLELDSTLSQSRIEFWNWILNFQFESKCLTLT